jgi:predicted DNA-binding protein (MmcQ/YjbR family)
MDNMERIETIVAGLPEAQRVDVAEWGDHPTFRVRGKSFIFCDATGSHLSVKLTKDEAAAVVATDAAVEPCGYGLGRHGWISFSVGRRVGAARWREIEEWIRTSYTLVAPRRLARLIEAEAGAGAGAGAREKRSR